MRIFAICLVKNEEDIVKYALEQASKWAHKVLVLDNGSSDNTWKIVNSLESDKIVPVGILNEPYREGFRSLIFHIFKNEVKEDDWWCIKLDIDEIYVDDPKDFLEKVPKNVQTVYSESYEYYLTHEDVVEYNFGNQFKDNVDKIKYYYPTTWSELVFFKHRQALQWDIDNSAPDYVGVPHDQKIKLRHYKYRSPDQIKKRIESRKNIDGLWLHERLDYLTNMHSRDELLYDDGSFYSDGCRNSHYKWPRYKIFAYRLLQMLKVLP